MRFAPESLLLTSLPIALVGCAVIAALLAGVGLALIVAGPLLVAYGVAVRTRQLWRWLRRRQDLNLNRRIDGSNLKE